MKSIQPISLLLVLMVIGISAVDGHGGTIEFSDDGGRLIRIDGEPQRVVSLVPSVTEILFRIGAGDAVKGVTRHDRYPPDAVLKENMGGFFSPCLDCIDRLHPDVVFYSEIQQEVRERFGNGRCRLVNLEITSIADSFDTIRLLGNMFNRDREATELIDSIQAELTIVSRKIANIPEGSRRRVIRFMGRDQVMTPGDDSFQNELIRAAGGIPPVFGKSGEVISITCEQWQTFNPQVIYGCYGDQPAAERWVARDGWRDVDAARNGHIYFFPCDLTCRAATRMGKFVTRLSSRLYGNQVPEFSAPVTPDAVLATRDVSVDLDYVKRAAVISSRIADVNHKTLVVDFKAPLEVLSTLDGPRQAVESVGNHFVPPAFWETCHRTDFRDIFNRVFDVLGKKASRTSCLMTGVDLDNLAIRKEQYRDMAVVAVVTAGVRSNAMCMAKDTGAYYEPGTINILILPNMSLSRRAMARAIITATEAKAAALSDLDIRSSYSPLATRATGTGTDNIVVVQGKGVSIDNAGGHTKMGELIARAVFKGVKEAVFNQNGITGSRSIFHRLEERHLSLAGIVSDQLCPCLGEPGSVVRAVERVLLNPRYAGFLESALALSDAHQSGLIGDLSAFDSWCRSTAGEIAGAPVGEMVQLIDSDDFPVVLEKALNAILNGIHVQAGLHTEVNNSAARYSGWFVNNPN